MTWWDLDASMAAASERLAGRPDGRQPRADAGASRLPPAVVAAAQAMFHAQERPRMRDVQAALAALCRRLRHRPPARATLYALLARCPPHQYAIAGLPDHVRATLYNLDAAGAVPGHQLAFHCFNYGDTRAASFAAGLPWLDLHQADRLRGWRARSHGLLRAVLRRRGIA